MRVQKADPDLRLLALLPGARFIDAYSGVVGDRPSARVVAARMFASSPEWVGALMRVRDRVMAPFGVKTAAHARPTNSVGIFPVVSETEARLVGGFDDAHLDFRVVVDVEPAGASSRVTATTIVLTHNALGQAYLAAIEPFHRLVVRSMVAQANRRSPLPRPPHRHGVDPAL